MKKVDVEAAKQILTQNFSNHLRELKKIFGSPEKFVENVI